MQDRTLENGLKIRVSAVQVRPCPVKNAVFGLWVGQNPKKFQRSSRIVIIKRAWPAWRRRRAGRRHSPSYRTSAWFGCWRAHQDRATLDTPGRGQDSETVRHYATRYRASRHTVMLIGEPTLRGGYCCEPSETACAGSTNLSGSRVSLVFSTPSRQEQTPTPHAPEELWKTYIQLTQAEFAFRTEKSGLNLRPVWHYLEDRVQAHILFSFLAYAICKILEQWTFRCGLDTGVSRGASSIASCIRSVIAVGD